MKKVGEQAKASSYLLAKSTTEQKNNFLYDLSKRIISIPMSAYLSVTEQNYIINSFDLFINKYL